MFSVKKVIYTLICIILFAACKKEHDSPQWDVGVLGPIVKGRLGVKNLINDTLFKVNSDSTLILIYNKSFYSLNIDSLVKIPDTTVTNFFVMPPIVNHLPLPPP